MDVYNKNRDKNNSISDEIREQNSKLKGAPLKDKLGYFKEYYLKTTLAAAAIAIFVFYISYSMITAPHTTAFAAFFYNDTGDSANTGLIDGFTDYMGIDTKKQIAYIDATMTYPPMGGDIDAYTGLEKAAAVITAKELDVIVGDTPTIDYFAGSECLYDISKILPDDLLENYKDRLYYVKTERFDEPVPVGIYVTDSPKLNEYHYYTDMEPVLGFVINSQNIDNAIEFLKYIYGNTD